MSLKDFFSFFLKFDFFSYSYGFSEYSLFFCVVFLSPFFLSVTIGGQPALNRYVVLTCPLTSDCEKTSPSVYKNKYKK